MKTAWVRENRYVRKGCCMKAKATEMMKLKQTTSSRRNQEGFLKGSEENNKNVKEHLRQAIKKSQETNKK